MPRYFCVKRRCDGLSIAIVDDVSTTGATLDALAKARCKKRAQNGSKAWVLARASDPQNLTNLLIYRIILTSDVYCCSLPAGNTAQYGQCPIRLCANTGCELHLVKPLGFPLEDAKLKPTPDSTIASTPAWWFTRTGKPVWPTLARAASSRPPPRAPRGTTASPSNPAMFAVRA